MYNHTFINKMKYSQRFAHNFYEEALPSGGSKHCRSKRGGSKRSGSKRSGSKRGGSKRRRVGGSRAHMDRERIIQQYLYDQRRRI
jgi:hypothetical protein